MEWMVHKPIFEYDKYTISIKDHSAWSGHRNFAYDLVRFMKPMQIVELGTHYGASLFSFCQGVKDEDLSTKCIAVDTWKGDEHSGLYGENVFRIVKEVVGFYYPDIAELIRTTFDEAVSLFQDQTIDILHIDGYHTFEAVSHDFYTWLPKVSENGIVLFHDIAVMGNGFGVYQLWDELKNKYPTIQFEHNYGLGVLFPKGFTENFKGLFQKENELQKIYKI